MQPDALYKLSGLAAFLGGALRIFSVLPLMNDPVALQWLYTAIDVLLVFGLVGIYLSRADTLGFLGLASFAVAMAGFSFIGGPDADPFGFSTYEQGAAVIGIAMAGFALAWVRAKQQPWSPALCWFASVIAIGVFNLLPAQMPSYGFMAAGILFGAGFVLAGTSLLSGRT